ncbi:MAG TPA: glycosyltransferase [Pyrinomonadaceae bacterium]|nr:glycosyltransferase [Pyrinomonadaceae bacterium]
MLKILFLGENWYGSCARACCFALRRQGHDVTDIDQQTVFPQLRRKASRAALRALRPMLSVEYNELILDTAHSFQPDLLLAFKGQFLAADTLRRLRADGIALYNYYPDTSAFAHGSMLQHSLPEYDCTFFTKEFLAEDVIKQVPLRETVYLPHGYDPEIHKPVHLDQRDRSQYQCDVGVIATFTARKEQLLDELVSIRPKINLRIWGNQWEKIGSRNLRPFICGAPLNGTSYAKAIRAFRINLAIMSGIVKGASQGDETTTRTYEIPACGGFMLHERTTEALRLYEEGKEIACFSTVEELAEKIDHYLAHPNERAQIAAAGHARCVPAYSYDNRMAEIVRWHEQHTASSHLTTAVAS